MDELSSRFPQIHGSPVVSKFRDRNYHRRDIDHDGRHGRIELAMVGLVLIDGKTVKTRDVCIGTIPPRFRQGWL